jgi:methylated-DNA-[protein]-cysteine S-methyltransferase
VLKGILPFTMDRKEDIKTPVGSLVAVFSDRGLKEISLPPCVQTPPAIHCGNSKRVPLTERGDLCSRFSLYFSGVPVEFSDVEIDLSGLGSFTQRILLALRELSYGQIITYGELARKVGSPKGQRAVGQAVGRNPVPIVIPCHRVVAEGGIGGFSEGLEWKRWLLGLESGV